MDNIEIYGVGCVFVIWLASFIASAAIAFLVIRALLKYIGG